MTRLKQITPLVPVADVNRSVAFFCNMLGFAVGSQSEDYAYLQRDDVGIRLVQVGPGVDTHDPKRQLACYIDVEGLDALFEELKPNLDKLPKGRVRAPFDQPYGQREFHVIDEDALLLFFGEPIEQTLP